MSLISMVSNRLPSRAILALLAVATVLGLGACGDSHTKVSGGTYAGESGANAPYLDVGPLVYEVQLSRQLNPFDTEDAAYLEGLTPAQRRLAPGEEWFGVFLQVYNNSETGHLASGALGMHITDTQGNVYLPTIPGATNPFAYRAGFLPGKARIPALDTVAANGSTQGALLLYKIKILSLDNRPLELHLVDPLDPSQTASAELDV
ncbi:MAG TPA: hypothetical protein VGY76_07485 [Solirubrobacteraceae bacterium]|jgi:hypothetical protein|nr:hypothetical protein [Solirubrobacteraceae bacterium]